MVSTWWLAGALLLGGLAAMLVFALMDMAQKEEDRAARLEKAVELQLLGLPGLDPHWGANRSRKPPRSRVSEAEPGGRMAA